MRRALIAVAVFALALPATAQTPPAGMPGTADPGRVRAGTYKVDPHHTHVVWSVNHLGFSILYGMVGAPTGTLVLDPARPSAAKLDLTFPINSVASTSEGFTRHLLSADFFDVAKFPTARFVSTSVSANGTGARIVGNLTLHGVTRPVTLDMRFTGAGDHPQSKKLNIGFEGTARIKRSEFGMGMAVPVVSDDVDLKLTGAFEKAD